MRLPRRMLVVAVMLASGLMAASEAPEILSLTDNASNDCELAWQRPPGCSSQQIVRRATTPTQRLVVPDSQRDLPPFSSSTTSLRQSPSLPLSMLGVQRK